MNWIGKIGILIIIVLFVGFIAVFWQAIADAFILGFLGSAYIDRETDVCSNPARFQIKSHVFSPIGLSLEIENQNYGDLNSVLIQASIDSELLITSNEFNGDDSILKDQTFEVTFDRLLDAGQHEASLKIEYKDRDGFVRTSIANCLGQVLN